jgi:hypothetical protein
MIQGAFSEITTDVILSSDDDDAAHPLDPDASAMPKGSADNDAGVVGTTSAETLIPGLIRVDTPKVPRPSAADQIPIVPPVRGRSWKRPSIVAKRSKPTPQVDQVII